MPTYRTAVVDAAHNDEELRLNLDLLEERHERAAIREAKSKSKITKHYNARVRGVTFRPRDFVYRNNNASHAVDGGKLGPKWEGPYEAKYPHNVPAAIRIFKKKSKKRAKDKQIQARSGKGKVKSVRTRESNFGAVAGERTRVTRVTGGNTYHYTTTTWDYVDASPPDVEIVSLEVVEIVDPEVGRINDDILLTIKDDIIREKLLNVNLLIAKIDALRDNPTPSSEIVIKSTSTFPNLFLEETNTFDNSIPESETFYFNLEEISSGSPTTHSKLSLPDYKAFYVDNDHFKERSSGSTTTHVDFSQYDSFIFDLSNNQFPPAGRSDLYHEEFADELTHIMSLPDLECFKFKIEPDPGSLTSIDTGIHKNASTTNVNVPLEDDQSSLFAYVVWIFLAFLTYPVVLPYLLSTGNEDTIFDPGISIYYSFMPDVSHRSGTFIKFNVYPNRLNKSPMMILPSICFPMDQ
ncbi:hypothetical protein Tco_1515775 [Tanacetum coccineum]